MNNATNSIVESFIVTANVLRGVCGWTEIDFATNDDVWIHPLPDGGAQALWTNAQGMACELGRLTAEEFATFRRRLRDLYAAGEAIADELAGQAEVAS